MAVGVLLLLLGGSTPVIALFFAALAGYIIGIAVRRTRG
jgi:hypothetical protein